MKSIVIPNFKRISLWTLTIFFATNLLFATQDNIELLLSDFAAKDSVGFKDLNTLIPRKLYELFYRAQQHGITASMVECDSIYRLNGRLKLRENDKKNYDLNVTCELTNVRTGRVNKIMNNVTIDTLSEKRLLEEENHLASKIADTIKTKLKWDLSAEDAYIYICDFDIQNEYYRRLGSLVDLIPKLLEKQLNSLDKYTAKSGVPAYLLDGDFRIDMYVLSVRTELTNVKTGNSEFPVETRSPQYTSNVYTAEKVAERLFNDLVFHLRKKVRIAVAEFSVLNDETTYESFGKAIAMMLKNGLKRSPQLTMVEIDQDTLIQKIIKAQKQRGIIDLYTVPELGKIMYPNYLVTGQFWLLNEKMGIEVQCVKIETGETIVSEGINVQHIDVDTIHVRINKLAAIIRQSIAKDIIRADIKKTISVVGLPPFPNTVDNRKRTKYIIRAISRKLKAVDSEKIKVKEDRDKIESFIDKPTDIWAIAADLDVDKLLIIQYEDYDEGDITIDVDIFDCKNLSTPVYSDLEYGKASAVKTMVDTIVRKSLDSLGIEKYKRHDNILIKKMEDISVRRIARPHSIGISYGRVITDEDGPLEYGENSSFAAYAFFPFHLYLRLPVLGTIADFDKDHFKAGPMITWDWGDNTLENLFLGEATSSVHLISFFICGKYSFLPENFINPYIGAGFGFLWLRRIWKEEHSFLHAPGKILAGYTGILGCEFKLSPKFYFIIPLKYYHTAWGRFDEEVRNGRSFNGGSLWGINIGIGLSYYW